MPGSLKPPVLVINIADDIEAKLWHTKYAELRSSLDREFNVTTATTLESAVNAMYPLQQPPRIQGRPPTPSTSAINGLPKVVLVVSSGIFEPGHTCSFFRLHQALAAYVGQAGGTLVFCANVPTYMDRVHSDAILQNAYNLRWNIGVYGRFEMKKNDDLQEVFQEGSFFFLVPEYHTIGLCLSGVPKNARVYSVMDDGESEHDLCMVAFEARDNGRIGFIGDNNLDRETASYEAVMAMIEFGVSNVFFSPTTRLQLPLCSASLNNIGHLVCKACLRPLHQEDTNTYCKICQITTYCSSSCRRYDRKSHEKVCSQNSKKETTKNRFSQLFPSIKSDNREDAIIRIIDSYRIWLHNLSVPPESSYVSYSSKKETLETTIYDYLSIGIFEDDQVVKGLEKWLSMAKDALAVPAWWDENADRELINYATWDQTNEQGEYALWGLSIDGSFQSDGRLGGLDRVKPGADVFIGREITRGHVRAQYGEQYNAEVDKIFQLWRIIGERKKTGVSGR